MSNTFITEIFKLLETLNDSEFEVRKSGITELENIIINKITLNNHDKILKFAELLISGATTTSNFSNENVNALVLGPVTMVKLLSNSPTPFLTKLTQTFLKNLHGYIEEDENKVVLVAADSVYNIIKLLPSEVLFKIFPEILNFILSVAF